MKPEQKNSRLAYVPSILAGTAAVVAAISTLYVNLREEPSPAPVAVVPVQATHADSSTSSNRPAAPKAMRWKLDRVQVDDDGSVGSTDWTFQVSVDAVPSFSVSMPALSDKPGKNLARPAEDQQASVDIELPAGRNVALSVSGWKKGWLGGARGEVNGSAWVTSGLTKTAIRVQGAKEKGPRFVLYFSAMPVIR
jgi:hypothetical protein